MRPGRSRRSVQVHVFLGLLTSCLTLLLLLPDEGLSLSTCDTTNSLNSQIYCNGPLLQANAYAYPNVDSKSFVDRPLKFDPDQVLANFTAQFGTVTPKIDVKKFGQFLDANFKEPGGELTVCTPSDWTPMPGKISRITDPNLKSWAVKIHQIWKELCRQMKPDVLKNPQRHSLLYVPHRFIAPGGRFREFYYWDTYWIIRGLLVSEMYDTAANVIRNFVYIFNKHGLIPNGGRVYYLQRSQPPMLTGMVYEYWKATRNQTFLAEVMPMLEKELRWWQTNRLFNVTGPNSQLYQAYQYHSYSNVPRPESYKEDTATAKGFGSAQAKEIYQNLASAAETGWDFSSRWLQKPTVQGGKWELKTVKLHNPAKALGYSSQRTKQRRMMNALFYNTTVKAYFDYHTDTKRQNINFYPSSAVPLFTGCYQSLNVYKPADLYRYMKTTGALSYPSGIPTSMHNTGQQWDMPNGWSPLQHFIINYNVTDPNARPGAGGEYTVQDGFGWTNGVVLDLINSYHDRMSILSPSNSSVDLIGQSYYWRVLTVFGAFLSSTIMVQFV